MAIPQTKVRTSLGLEVRAKGVTVGFIQSWNVSLTRTVTPVYELNPVSGGKPVDLVPGNDTDLRIDVGRMDLHRKKMEDVFGTTNIAMLSDQSNPFEVIESWMNPDGSVERYVYTGCYFSRISRRVDATGNRTIVVEGTINYVERRKL